MFLFSLPLEHGQHPSDSKAAVMRAPGGWQHHTYLGTGVEDSEPGWAGAENGMLFPPTLAVITAVGELEVDWVIQCFLASVTPGKCAHMRRTSWKFKEPLSCYAMLSGFSRVQLLATPRTVACQAPLPMGFSRQEYWSELPCPPPGDLLNPGTNVTFLPSPVLASGFVILVPPYKPGRA